MEKEILLKQLHYRSNYRGCKETDILLGKFFNEKFREFNDLQLETYRRFIEEDDMLIYDWILGNIAFKDEYESIIAKIRSFHDISF
jgi:antitoxin CptB